jgi:putative ABC transport system permease protein
MLRLGLSSLWSHRRRLIGTGIAITLGVAFLTGTLVLGDTLSHNFDTLFREVSAGTDVVVRNSTSVDSSARGVDTRGPIDADLVDQVRGVDGVSVVEPQVLGYGSLIGADGKAVGGNGPPRQAGSWIGTPALNPYKLVEGRAPQAPDEVVLNRGAAKAGKLHLGDRVVVQTPQPVDVTVVGIATFGSADGFGQTTFAGFTLDGAQQNVLHQDGRITSILVAAAPGISQETLRDRIAAVLPAGAQAITGDQFTNERIDAIGTTFLNLLRAMLVVFAGIALVVATLSINNTFSITVAQRTRELGLLRAVGASRRQVRSLMFIEAIAVGVVAAAIGTVVGLGVAGLLKGLFDAFGGALPAGGLTIKPISLVIGLVVGVVVTLVAAQMSARRAARVAPMAALRDAAVEQRRVGTRRVLTGTALIAVGIAVGIAAVATGAALLSLVSALVLVVAVLIVAPIVLSPTARVLGAVLRRLRGLNGALAEENARRNPRRTAATASALIVGVAVVTIITVLVGSLRATLTDGVERGFASDLSVNTAAFGGSQLGPAIIDDLGSVAGVSHAVGLSEGLALVDGSSTEVSATDMSAVATVVHVDMVQGALADAGSDGIAVSKDKAAAEHWTVGTVVPITFADGSSVDAAIRAIYRQDDVLGGIVIAQSLWTAHTPQPSFRTVFIDVAPGTSPTTAKAAIGPVATRYGGTVQDRAGYAAARAGGLDLLLGIVYVLLALAIVIALLGIGNTLSLSVWERRHEIGLLRAVGQTRSQVRSTLRLESVIVSTFGALTGLVLGGFLGWMFFRTLADADAIFALPTGRLVVIAVIGAVAGAIASLRPARRAARLPVLEAIATV